MVEHQYLFYNTVEVQSILSTYVPSLASAVSSFDSGPTGDVCGLVFGTSNCGEAFSVTYNYIFDSKCLYSFRSNFCKTSIFKLRSYVVITANVMFPKGIHR